MNKKLIRTVVICLLLLFPLCNLISSLLDGGHKQLDVSPDGSVLSSLEKIGVAQVESEIEHLEELKLQDEAARRLSEERQAGISAVVTQISSGKTSYRELYKNVLVVGDSLMRGLETYKILDSSNMITQVSANLSHLSANADKIINNNPKILVLHYGLNMIGTMPAHLNSYINQYTSIITRLKAGLPNTKIVISGLFPTTAQAAAKHSKFNHVGEYNVALRKLCNENGLTFLDNSGLLTGHGDMYEKDGIHLKKMFYTSLWLPYTAVQLKL